VTSPLRLIFDIFDDRYIGKKDKITLKNINTIRNFIKDKIKERREDLKNPEF
jgi:hypothetical protein